MSNDLTVFDPNNVAVPAHFQQGNVESNILARQTVPSLGLKGKIWAISLDGNSTPLTAPNEDGDKVPISIFRAVILHSAPRRGRAYYEGDYDPSNTASPVCWSPDGKLPDPHSEKRQAETCDNCPKAVKGSKVSDGGKATVACGQHRLMALVPSFKLDFQPLRLKIAITSDYDKNNVEPGWFAWQQYQDFLKSRGIVNTGQVVTKMKFDTNESYPKVLFSVDRWTTADEWDYIQELQKKPEVMELITESWTPNGVDGTRTDDETAKPAAEPQPVNPTPATEQPTPEPQPEPEPDLSNLTGGQPASSTPAPAATEQPAQAQDADLAAQLSHAMGNEPQGSTVVPNTPAQAPETTTAPSPETTTAPSPESPSAPSDDEVPEDVKNLLGDWGNM